MKTQIIFLLLLSISILPLAISHSGLPPLIRLPTNPDLTSFHSAILDTAGNPVVAGAKYYAIPALIGVEGGISVTNLNTTTNPSASCPTDVVINETIAGNQPPAVAVPLTFYPLIDEAEASRADVITQQYPLNVAFDWADPSDPCAKENVWKLNMQGKIVTGGVIGEVDKDNYLANWFRIQENFDGRGYLFNWWPSLCLFCKIGYSFIGTVGDGYLQLGIIDHTGESRYAFELVKAE